MPIIKTTTFKNDLEKTVKFEAWCQANDTNISQVLRGFIDSIIEDSGELTLKPRLKESRRKITISCSPEDFEKFEILALKEKQTVSSLCGSIFATYIRNAPKPPRRERYIAIKALRQIMGIGINVNQIAEVMNKSVFTGKRYAPAKRELEAIKNEIKIIHSEFLQYGKGLLKFQKGEADE